ncbi:MAG: DNA-processing protein DprA [Rhodobacteraceae bacterium]|nr:DNA-processing protein DprA [Paracoccaceae bacterium]MCY4249989.1 DNA-processing protein DprA [Paracoccaceae bacterium]
MKDNQSQKAQENGYHQCSNLDRVFEIQTPMPEGAVLLIDDVFDSGWTMTIAAALLRRAEGDMNISSDTHATILLTVRLGKQQEKPLTINEWSNLSKLLKENKLPPSILLQEDPKYLPCEWKKAEIDHHRIKCLLNRGGALGFALEKWQRTGLWVISQSDKDYPARLIYLLGTKAPPILFGYGNQNLLNKGGIAVVGSRNADHEDMDLTKVLGYEAARQGHSIVSGAARGVDEGAMLGTLENEGTAIGVIANDLLRSALSRKYRKYLLSGDLVLTSPFNPESGFNVGNAMARNKYIYCLADAAIVVNSKTGKGGTWTGAIEGLKSKWVPVWVQKKEFKKTGNIDLFERGAVWLPNNLSSFRGLIEVDTTQPSEPDLYELFLKKLLTLLKAKPLERIQIETEFKLHPDQTKEWLKQVEKDGVTRKRVNPVRYELQSLSLFDISKSSELNCVDFKFDPFELFLDKLNRLTSDSPLKIEDIISQFDLLPKQVKIWLNKGVKEGYIGKFYRPLRYQSISQ